MTSLTPTFTLAKSIPVLIYGAGEQGRSICRRLTECGYLVQGFIDKACTKTALLDNIPIYPTSFFLREKNSFLNCIIILSLQNGLQHEKTARYLSVEGFTKLIYLPMHIGQDLETRSILRKVYRNILNGAFNSIDKIPFYSDDSSSVITIEKTDRYTVFWCPVDTLMITADGNAPICVLESSPYTELIKYLQGEKANIDLYLDMQKRISRHSRDQLLEDRKELFQIYEQAFRYEQSFFTDSPAQVIWNPSGWFQVLDGLHRIHFLLHKGYQAVPVYAANQDYLAFLQENNYKNGKKR